MDRAVVGGTGRGEGQGLGAGPQLCSLAVCSILVAVPAACFLVPLCLLLLVQALSVSAAERSCEGKVCGAQGAPLYGAVGGSPGLSGTSALSFSTALVTDGPTFLQDASLALTDPA